MSNLHVIERLARMLNDAADIIRAQAELLEQHGISVDGAEELAHERQELLEDIENNV